MGEKAKRARKDTTLLLLRIDAFPSLQVASPLLLVGHFLEALVIGNQVFGLAQFGSVISSFQQCLLVVVQCRLPVNVVIDRSLHHLQELVFANHLHMRPSSLPG